MRGRDYNIGAVRGYRIGLAFGCLFGAAMMTRGGWLLVAIGAVLMQLVVVMIARWKGEI